MNFDKDGKSFVDSYGMTKEDAVEVLLVRLEKLVEELKEAVKWTLTSKDT